MDKSNKRKNWHYKPGRGGSNNWNNKRKFKNYLQPGMKGFLCTCNIREKDCIREALNILNEYAEKLYGSDEWLQPRATKEEGEEPSAGDSTGDIEDDLKKEVSSLKASQWTPRRFEVIDTGVTNNVFIKSTVEDPVKLGLTILHDVEATKTQKARFLLRIVPVEVTCRANLEDIKTAADALFDKHFRCEPTTFAVVINKRYNDSLLRDEVIHALALLVTDKNREHKANLKEAQWTVLVEIMKGQCCLSVLEDYRKLKRYNLAELTKPESAEEESEKPAEGQVEGVKTEEDQGRDPENEIPSSNPFVKDEPESDDDLESSIKTEEATFKEKPKRDEESENKVIMNDEPENDNNLESNIKTETASEEKPA